MRLRPHLMFQGEMEAALAAWGEAFPQMTVRRLGEGRAEMTLGDQNVSLFDSPPVHAFGFTPAFSFAVECDGSDEVDRLAAMLGEGGETLMPPSAYEFADRFAWVQDRFGVSWQLSAGPS